MAPGSLQPTLLQFSRKRICCGSSLTLKLSLRNMSAVNIFLSSVWIKFSNFWMFELPGDGAACNALTSDPWWSVSAVRWISSLMGSCLLSACMASEVYFQPKLWLFPCCLRLFVLSFWYLRIKAFSGSLVQVLSSFPWLSVTWRITGWHGNTPVTAEEKWNGRLL